jgi:hypothetical protein
MAIDLLQDPNGGLIPDVLGGTTSLLPGDHPTLPPVTKPPATPPAGAPIAPDSAPWTGPSVNYGSGEVGQGNTAGAGTGTGDWGTPWTGDPASFVKAFINKAGLTASQTNPQIFQQIAAALKQHGVNASPAAAGSGGYYKGINIDGNFVKLVDGNNNWIWMPGGDGPSAGGGDGAGGSSAGASPWGTGGAGSIFSDPSGALLESTIMSRLGDLAKPLTNPAMDSFLAAAQKQIEQLNQPVYTPQEEAALRTKVFDQLEQDRQQAIQQTTEHMAALGHGRESGTIPAAIALVNKHFDELRAQQTNALLTGTIQERQARLKEALGISGQVATMTAAQQAQEDARKATAVSTAAILPNLVDSRLALANGTLGSGGANPNDLMSSISQLIKEQQTNTGNSAANWAAIGQIIAEALAGK